MVSVSAVKGLYLTQSVVLIVLSLLCAGQSSLTLCVGCCQGTSLHSDDLAPPDDAKSAYLIRCNIRVGHEMAVPVQRSIAAMKRRRARWVRSQRGFVGERLGRHGRFNGA